MEDQNLREILLDVNDYNTNEERKGLLALAQTVQNLVIHEPDTYPNMPGLGVGIENYQFELIDDETINDLTDKVNSNIEKFIPTDVSIECKIDIVENELKQNIIIMSFVVTGLSDYNTVDKFTVAFGKNPFNHSLVSKIIL
jgi:hypothetical protein